MKAAILTKQNAPLEIEEVDIPSLEVGQVLVRLAYSGICGKQLEEIDGRRGDDIYIPHMLGHEGGGVVEDVGLGVKKVKAGDHVVLHWMKGSGIDSAVPKFTSHGKPINAGWVTTFSQYTIASENRVTPISKELDLDIASLFGCAVSTGLGIVFNNASMQPGQSIAVFGVGGLGINVIQGAALVNAYPIVAVDLFDDKLVRASEFGATHTINSSGADSNELLRELSENRGFDVTVDLTGNTLVRQMAYDLCSNTGRTIFAGVPHFQELITIDSFPLHFGRTVIGSHGGDTKPDQDIPRYSRLYQLGKLKLAEQITHRYRLEEINTAIDTIKRGESGRVVISTE